MIDQDHLQIGNTVYCPFYDSEVTAKITKVGRKYTYTDNRAFIIENSRLMTKHTGFGNSSYRVYKSKEDYEEYRQACEFIMKVRYAVSNTTFNLAQARMLNKELNLGIEE